jgi:uncharacterized membrane protein
MGKSSTGLEDNVAGLLCYLFGWLTGLLFLLIERDSEFVRFHARQSVALFGLLTVLTILAPVLPLIGALLSSLVAAAGFVAWIVMMVFAGQGKRVAVPVVIDLADRLK